MRECLGYEFVNISAHYPRAYPSATIAPVITHYRSSLLPPRGRFLPTGRFGLVNLCQIPNGLNAGDLERFLRLNGAQTRGFQSTQDRLNRRRSEG
jgi:hypothetical protein